MAEPKNPESPETAEPTVVKTARVRTFINNHPRTAKVAGFTAAALTAVGVAVAVKSVASKTDVDGSANLELSFDTSPTDATPAPEA